MKCDHCHKREVNIASRKLCKKCYDWLRRHGRVEEYPKIDLYRDRLIRKYGKNVIKDFICAGGRYSLSDLARVYGFSREYASYIFEKLFNKKYSEVMKRR